MILLATQITVLHDTPLVDNHCTNIFKLIAKLLSQDPLLVLILLFIL